MPYFQRAEIMGVTGEDAADLQFLANGTPFSHFNVCVEERWRDQITGEKRAVKTWFRCSAWGKIANQANKVLKPGTWVYCEGRMRCRKADNGVEFWSLTVDGFRKLSRPDPADIHPQDSEGESDGVPGRPQRTR